MLVYNWKNTYGTDISNYLNLMHSANIVFWKDEVTDELTIVLTRCQNMLMKFQSDSHKVITELEA